jgi:hypothetical protein
MSPSPLLRRRATPPCLVASLALALVTLAPFRARAELGGQVAADLDLGAPMGGSSDTSMLALGVGGRFGWRFGLGLAWLQPEVGGQYVGLVPCSSDLCDISGPRHAVRVFGGLRLGGSGLVSKVIEPSLFGHAGYGWIGSGLGGPSFDVGFALDVVAVRLFRFGVHAVYGDVAARKPEPNVETGVVTVTASWLAFGVHTGVAF